MKEQTVYEIGYLLSPLLPEAEALDRVETLIKNKITALGGAILSSVGPKMIPLAYTMTKVTDNKKSVFGDAYFGAVKFELAAEEAPRLHKDWSEAVEIIRHLLIKTQREEVVVVPPVEAPIEENKASLDDVIDREIAGMITV